MEPIFPSYDHGILISENTSWHIGDIREVFKKMIADGAEEVNEKI